MWVTHDVALLDLSILLEQTGDFILAQAWVDAGDEEVGARVSGLVVVAVVALGWLSLAAAGLVLDRVWCRRRCKGSPIAAAVGGLLVARAHVDVTIAVDNRRARAVARGVVAFTVVCA